MLLFGFGSVRVRLLIVSLGLIGTGAWMYAPTWNASEQVDCNLAQLSSRALPKSNWVRLRGRLLWDEAATEERRGHVRAYFVPLVSGSWQSGQPVHVIVRVSEFAADDLQEDATIEGLIQPLGLPIDLRMAFSGDGLEPAKDVVYIHHGTDPNSQRRFAQIVLAIGFAGVGGFFAIGRFGASDKSTSYHSMSKARNLNDAVRRNEEEELKRLEREAQRESEVQRWLREHNMSAKSGGQNAPSAKPEVGASR
ncbi:MAG: hypothetical protein ACT4QC_22070 [Planctomycetaceae bacterium]